VVAIEPYAVSRDGGSGATESGATIPSYPTKRRQHHHSDSCTNALFLIFNRLALLLVSYLDEVGLVYLEAGDVQRLG
jgi:hypothetical protein